MSLCFSFLFKAVKTQIFLPMKESMLWASNPQMGIKALLGLTGPEGPCPIKQFFPIVEMLQFDKPLPSIDLKSEFHPPFLVFLCGKNPLF